MLLTRASAERVSKGLKEPTDTAPKGLFRCILVVCSLTRSFLRFLPRLKNKVARLKCDKKYKQFKFLFILIFSIKLKNNKACAIIKKEKANHDKNGIHCYVEIFFLQRYDSRFLG